MNFQSYTVKIDHRNASKASEKSQWTVPTWEEVTLFVEAKTNGWHDTKNNYLWAVRPGLGGYPEVIGTEKIGSKVNELHIAKFRCDQDVWHGYPVASVHHDIPPSSVLRIWAKEGLVKLSVANRWQQGKR